MTKNPPELHDDFYYRDVPQYMTEVYDWAYVNPRHAAWLDRNLVVRVLLFGNDRRLMQAYLDRVRPGMKVWQVAHVYGDLVQRVARKVGPQGGFDLTDVTPVQIAHASRKLSQMPQARVVQADAADFRGEPDYDLIVSFFLLHEVPDNKKREIVDNMLDQLPRGARALFVDYHRPAAWQPIGWLLRWVNRCLEPFAMALWQHEIQEYAREAGRFDWRKRTVFGGVYQIVEVTHKA
ncbi:MULTISPECIES: rhodoquinone biosynthesis methyltransferase RquA [unclassified Paludibacterium]|uniref:rhodoquinone biosynthesis methyltransferase RquA n=1 Tax=unclassified Paludibacterium TaxID=2618429 RepID=UPI001C046881|nr:rhodoquinone biosynthesis methyltransferase RquA [Paludibacterium sp. B53371]BEV73236.1 rhodoquinone biosynthesis methyltransferase RquA [Paludibacterium sp. THUN1379]